MAKFGDEWDNRCKLNFNTIWERHIGLSYVDILLPFEHNA